MTLFAGLVIPELRQTKDSYLFFRRINSLPTISFLTKELLQLNQLNFYLKIIRLSISHI